MINWDTVKREDGTIDLCLAYTRVCERRGKVASEDALRFLDMIQLLRPITSLEVAALALSIVGAILWT